MQNENTKFEVLMEHASSCLGKSVQDLRNTYKNHPICLMEYIENDAHDFSIEVRFDDLQATLTFSLENNEVCSASHLFFDTLKDEESLIDQLIESANYIFRKSYWQLPTCCVKVKETMGFTCFRFYH